MPLLLKVDYLLRDVTYTVYILWIITAGTALNHTRDLD